MKKLKLVFMSIGVLMSALLVQSCLDNDSNDDLLFPNALVTVKHAADKTFYLQLDDNTTLLPTNMKESPYGDKEVRALVNYTETAEASSPYSKAVYVNWLDSILTKPTVLDLGDDNDKTYGNDPVEIVRDWVTIAEDGYLTLRFRTRWGSMTPHRVNLLTNGNPDNPYEVEFRHDAKGDLLGDFNDALVAFNLKDLPDTDGKTVKLKLKWNSFSGPKSVEFDYCSRKTTATGNLQVDNQRLFGEVK